MNKRSGKKSSPLDDIRPASWSFDGELLELLWVLDATVDRLPAGFLMSSRSIRPPNQDGRPEKSVLLV
jgi:hypothetical protein